VGWSLVVHTRIHDLTAIRFWQSLLVSLILNRQHVSRLQNPAVALLRLMGLAPEHRGPGRAPDPPRATAQTDVQYRDQQTVLDNQPGFQYQHRL